MIFINILKKGKTRTMKKKAISRIVSMVLLSCMLATSALAATSNGAVKNGSTTYGSVYLNAKSSSIYAETSANSSGTLDTDSVTISASNCTPVTNTGKNYTTAYTSVSGSFSGNKTAAGTIVRNGRIATGATSVTI